LGKKEISWRDSVLYFGLDGKLMSVKWKNFKVIFRTAKSITDPITDVQMPMVFDLIGDPGERYNIFEYSMDMAWVFRPVYEVIASFQQSVVKYPNIGTGEDFKGYT
jgi:arylsulfatase